MTTLRQRRDIIASIERASRRRQRNIAQADREAASTAVAYLDGRAWGALVQDGDRDSHAANKAVAAWLRKTYQV